MSIQPKDKRLLAGLVLARPAGSSFLVIASRGDPWHWLLYTALHVFFRAVRGFRIRPRRRQATSRPGSLQLVALLSSKLRRRQDKPRFELSNMGLPSIFAFARAGVLCGIPRSQTGHRSHGSPTGRATDAVMLLGDGASYAHGALVSPSRRSPGIQALLVLQPQVCRRADRLPHLLWRFAFNCGGGVLDPVSISVRPGLLENPRV